MCRDHFVENSGHAAFLANCRENNPSTESTVSMRRGNDVLVQECFEACAIASRLQDDDAALSAVDATVMQESWEKLLYSIATAKAGDITGVMAKRSVLKACLDIEGRKLDWFSVLVRSFCSDIDAIVTLAERGCDGVISLSSRSKRRGLRFFGLEVVIEWAPVRRR